MEYTHADAVALCGIATEIRQQQAMLNDMYSPDWRETYQADKITLSATMEFSEMLDEVKGSWKFYGTQYQNDWAAALEEFVDIVHFMATVEWCNGASPVYDNASPVVISAWARGALRGKSQSYLLSSIHRNMKRGSFLQLLAFGCMTFKLTPEQLLVAYLHKNKKNQTRAQAGAISRDVGDIKAAEQSTFDYMYQNGFISMTRDEYNQAVDSNG